MINDELVIHPHLYLFMIYVFRRFSRAATLVNTSSIRVADTEKILKINCALLKRISKYIVILLS